LTVSTLISNFWIFELFDSFFYQDYIFYAYVLSSFDPVHNAYIVDQDYVGACHLKNYFFCYHLPTRERAGVKLGDADMYLTYL
jgi:hypothetical protein